MTETSINAPTRALPRVQWAALAAIAAAVTLLHLLTNGRYGFHRDEWQFLSDACHLDWGFVAYPPFTPFVEHISLALFGLSLVGLRLASVLTQASAIVVTGLMTREFGGGRLAQPTAAMTVALAPLPLFEGTEFQYSSFDYLWWVLIAFFTIRLLRTDNPRWWMAIGAAVGMGLETKYSIVFFIAGILVGVVFTSARRSLKSPLVLGRTFAGAGDFSAQFSLAGAPRVHQLPFSSAHPHARRCRRPRRWLSRRPVPHLHQSVFCAGVDRRARGFLAAAAAIACWAGCSWCPWRCSSLPRAAGITWRRRIRWCWRWARRRRSGGWRSLPRWGRRTVEDVFFAGLAVCGAYVIAIIFPLAQSGPLRSFALDKNGDLREEFGWQRTGGDGGGDSRPADAAAAGQPGHRGGQLRRGGRD